MAFAGHDSKGAHLIVSMLASEWVTLAEAQGINTGYRSRYEDEKKLGSTLDPDKILASVKRVNNFKPLTLELERTGKSLLEMVALINSQCNLK